LADGTDHRTGRDGLFDAVGAADPDRPRRVFVVPSRAEDLGGKPDVLGYAVAAHDPVEVGLQLGLLSEVLAPVV